MIALAEPGSIEDFDDVEQLQELHDVLAAAIRPDQAYTVSQWADTHRILTKRESSEPGRWRTDRTPYLREPMDCLSADSPVEKVVFKASSQTGKSEVGSCFIGYTIHHAPGPMLAVQPTSNTAKKWSRQRVTPLIEASEVLRSRVAPPRSRDASNSLNLKEFPGGMLMIGGANSAAELASMPIQALFCDEVDKWPSEVDGESNPLAQAIQRTQNFPRRKILIASTPTIEGFSTIDNQYEDSDKREFWVPCGDCGKEQVLKWDQVRWQKDHRGGSGATRHKPETAAYVCEHCGSTWDDPTRIRNVQGGRWIAQKSFNGTAGFWIWAAYSPWVKLASLAKEFLAAKRTNDLQPFINLKLGLVFRPDAHAVDATGLSKRREEYALDPLPAGVVLITMGVDTQDDRLELEILGWGRDEETWSLDYRVIPGDTSTPRPWNALDKVLEEVYKHPAGCKMRIAAAAIDTQGHSTQHVYKYCKARLDRNVFAIRGQGGTGTPIVGVASKENRQRVMLFPVGVDTVKATVMQRLKIEKPEKWEGEPMPGYCHFPKRYRDQYFKGLTAERALIKEQRGYRKIEWVKKPGARNEPLDSRVYNHAALELLAVDLEVLATAIEAISGGKPVPVKQKRRRRVLSQGVEA